MSFSNPSPVLNIIARYSVPLERLARRIILHKHRAPDIVKWTLESIEEEDNLHEGPGLRALLIHRTKDMALGFNRAIEIYTEIKENGKAIHRNPGNPIHPQQ
ncbi:MAG: hypothetical protein EOO06_05490 [Chitinophagaceae bacterium]|nr:MAG: hypothetical protein EOO06_05490 [Chitinophagaceae bacterium]